MGRTTNILDLNNRLEKVEKENVTQNSYISLKNKPKINSVTLTGNKTLADIGAAADDELGDLTQLTTTDKTSVVAAINEVVDRIKTETITGSGTTDRYGMIVTQINADRFINARVTLDAADGNLMYNMSTFSSTGKLVLTVINSIDFSFVANTTVYYKILARKEI